MKRQYLIPILLFVITLATTGCNKSSEESDPVLEEYHIRYTATVAAPADTISISYRRTDGTSEHVEKTFPDGKFQATVGPVIAGFEARIVSAAKIDHPLPTLTIEVSKGKGAYEVKKTKENAITLSYTVGD